MKEFYTSPVIEITKFHVENIITDSGTSDSLREETVETPPVMDADDVFYS